MKHIFLVLFGILIIAVSCVDKIEKDIVQVIEQRKTAYNKKNLELYSSILSKNYIKKVEDVEETNEIAEKNFNINTAPFDSIVMSHKDRTIYIDGDNAKVVQKTYVVLDIDKKKNNFELTEIILLSKEGNNWKITKESNIDLFRGYVFGKQ
ncbi:MAG: hypothetical protein ACR2NW_02755 [Thermodesulfobacteriota bacterium]